MLGELSEIIKYDFENTELLLEALTHPSTAKKNDDRTKFNYERLELLGDSVLSLVITEYLIKHYANESEGELSKRKAYMVSSNVLSKIAKEKINLGKFLIISKGEELTGGRDKTTNLENCLEAILGAIFLDSSFESVKKIILRLWEDIDDIEVPKSAKTELQEWTQENLKLLPTYVINETANNLKEITFSCNLNVSNIGSVSADGKSKKEAEIKCAELMLNLIKNNKNNGERNT